MMETETCCSWVPPVPRAPVMWASVKIPFVIQHGLRTLAHCIPTCPPEKLAPCCPGSGKGVCLRAGPEALCVSPEVPSMAWPRLKSEHLQDAFPRVPNCSLCPTHDLSAPPRPQHTQSPTHTQPSEARHATFTKQVPPPCRFFSPHDFLRQEYSYFPKIRTWGWGGRKAVYPSSRHST